MKIEFQSGNLTLDAFMNRGYYDYPTLLECAAAGTGVAFEYECIELPTDLDEYDRSVLGISIPEGHLRIGNRLMKEYTIVSVHLLDPMLFDFASKLLKAAEKDTKIKQSWREAMAQGIQKLKEKIEKG